MGSPAELAAPDLRRVGAPHLVRPTAGGCGLSGPHSSRLLVGHIDDREASEVLFGLGVWAIGEDGTPLDASTLNTGT